MAAGTVTPERSSSRWLIILLKVFLVVLGLAMTFTLYKYSWFLGTTSFLLTVLLGLLIFLPADFRKLGLFLFVNLVITTVIAGWLQRQFARDELVRHFIARNEVLTFLLQGFGETVFWSLVLGLLISLAITVIPLLIVAYVGAVYVLSLHQMEGLGVWNAMRHMISLLLGINLPSIVVQNGEAVVTKKGARLALIGGPGHLIVKQGNVVVLERGGKITRIVNAGITNLKPLENIRNVFNLKVHSFTTNVKHVLTRDRIPLTISITIKFQVEPASEADNRPESRLAPIGEALTPKLDDGLYQVYEGTIRKAALTSQAISLDTRQVKKCREEYCIDLEQTEWQKVAGSAPEAELRDYIMTHRLDELFELAADPDGARPEPQVNRRKIYEIEQAILEQIRSSKISNLGVLVRAVDIGKIDLPAKLRNAYIESMSSSERASGQANAIESVGIAKTETIVALMDRTIALINDQLLFADNEVVRQFIIVLQSMYQRALMDDVLAKDMVEANAEALGKLAESEGPKVFSTGMLMDPSQLLPLSMKNNKEKSS